MLTNYYVISNHEISTFYKLFKSFKSIFLRDRSNISLRKIHFFLPHNFWMCIQGSRINVMSEYLSNDLKRASLTHGKNLNVFLGECNLQKRFQQHTKNIGHFRPKRALFRGIIVNVSKCKKKLVIRRAIDIKFGFHW